MTPCQNIHFAPRQVVCSQPARLLNLICWLRKGKKTESLNAGAFMAGSVSNIQTSLGVTKDAEPRQIFAKIRSAQRFGGMDFGELTLFINRTPLSIHALLGLAWRKKASG
jgi:hypothetical protein